VRLEGRKAVLQPFISILAQLRGETHRISLLSEGWQTIGEIFQREAVTSSRSI
jgi:hypothetical protein